ncbi:GspE/PulE family protein [Gilvimarinus chinensis]|uniref:GspE/PulE family protein n=1 Tax=Gilvimarinus chinensis TaxID=396005 RepID=UPI0003A2AD64|nr:ATPase, T2SS/T4P/T4SS family [Gilvimarinus chinensis]
MTSDMQSIADMCGTSPVLDMRDIAGTPVQDERLRSYLADMQSCVLLDTDELLTADITHKGLQTARRAKDFLKTSHGLDVTIRPAEQQIVSMLRSNNAVPQGAAEEPTQSELNNVERSAIQRLLDILVQSAYQAGSSDVHIETDEILGRSIVKFRVLGKLVEQTGTSFRLTAEQGRKLGALIVNFESYRTGGTSPKPFDVNIPVDASVTVEISVGGRLRKVKIRYAHQPMDDPKGISIVLRLLSADGEGKNPTFVELGYSSGQVALQEKAFAFPHGIVLYVGPTGSGKSTALSAGVTILAKDGTRKIITYEDPVENRIPGVCQTQVNEKRPETSWASYSKSTMRQDPDVIVYGEIRDHEVQSSAFQQANTGHLVLSTLHANSAVVAIERMVDLGAQPSRLASPGLIRAIIAQRLVPELCPACSQCLENVVDNPRATDNHRRVWDHFKKVAAENNPGALKRIRTKAVGENNCQHCDGHGISGRVPIAEIIFLDKLGRGYIRNGDLNGWLDYLKSTGWKSMEDNAADKILSGRLCPIIVEKSLESPYGINADSFDYAQFDRDIESRRIAEIESRQAAITNKPLEVVEHG